MGLGKALNYALELGISQFIEVKCLDLTKELYNKLNDIDGLVIHHGKNSYAGIISFTIKGIDSKSVKDMLWSNDDRKNFELSVVPATSTPLDSGRWAAVDLLRASIHYTTTTDDINAFCDALKQIIDSNK